MSRKVLGVILALVVVIVAGGFVVVQLQEQKRRVVRERPEHVDRYYDSAAIQQYQVAMNGPNVVVSGVVVNTTWKSRDVGVWAGFVKSDGFHEGAGTGRQYYDYQVFPQVKPKETRTFSITFGAPPMNKNWSVIAEFDPRPTRLRPVW